MYLLANCNRWRQGDTDIGGLPVGGDLEYADELTLGRHWKEDANFRVRPKQRWGGADWGSPDQCVAGSDTSLVRNSDIRKDGLCNYVTKISEILQDEPDCG